MDGTPPSPKCPSTGQESSSTSRLHSSVWVNTVWSAVAFPESSRRIWSPCPWGSLASPMAWFAWCETGSPQSSWTPCWRSRTPRKPWWRGAWSGARCASTEECTCRKCRPCTPGRSSSFASHVPGTAHSSPASPDWMSCESAIVAQLGSLAFASASAHLVSQGERQGL